MAATGARLATGWLELTVSTAGAQKSITDEVVPGAKKAGDEAGASLGSQMLGGLKKFAGPIAAIVAGFSVAKVVKDSEKAFMDLVGATNALQRIAGGTKEEVSGLRAAMQLSGVDADGATGALTIFSKNLGNAAADADKAAAMQDKLGVAFLDAAGNVKPMSEILPGLSDKFKAMPDGAEKTALATQLFGRSGAQMLPFLNKGSEGIGQLTDKAKAMGLVIDDVSSKTFANAKASQREYNMSLQGLSATLGGTLLPITTAFGNIYRQSMIPLIQAATGILASHRDTFVAVGERIQNVANKTGAIVGGLFALFARGDLSGGFLRALGVQEDDKIIDVLFRIREGVIAVVDGIKGPLGEIGRAIGGVFAQLGPVFAQLLPPLLELWTALSPVQLILQAFLPVIPQIVSLVGTLATTLGGALGSALLAIAPPLVQVGQVVLTALTGALTAILPPIAQFATILGGVLAQAIQIVAPILVQIVGILGGGLAQVLGIIGPLLGQLGPILGQIVVALAPLISGILQLITPLLELVGPILQPLMGLFVALLPPILEVATVIASSLLPVVTGLLQILQGLIDFVVGVFTGNWSQAWSGVQTMFEGVMSTIGAVVSAAGQIIGAVWDGVLAVLGAVVGWIGSAFQGAFQALGDFFGGLWRGISDGITGAWTGAMDFLGSIPDRIRGFFAGIGSWLINAGRDLIGGFVDGISSMIGAVGDAIGGVMDFIGGFFPPSPAKRGPFSGSGWTAVRSGGEALMEQFVAGAEATRFDAPMQAAFDSIGRVPPRRPADTPPWGAEDAGLDGRGAQIAIYTNDPDLVGTVVADKLRRR